MDPVELRSLLNEGIAAVRANDPARARDCLLRVVEADERSEPGWLWLSAALDDPRDQLLALEHVLAINPHHPQAAAGVQALRQRLGQASAVAPAATPAAAADPPGLTLPASAETVTGTTPAAAIVGSAPSPPKSAAAVYDTLSAEDDPYQCAYCGQLTRPDDDRCRHCGRSLLAPGPWRGGGYLYLGLLVTGLQLQLALVQALASYIMTTYPQATRFLPVSWFWSSSPLVPATIRAIAWAVVVLLLLGDYAGGYGIGALVALVDLLWAGAGYRLGYLAVPKDAINTGLSVVIFAVGLMAVISQAQARVRLRVGPDRGLVGAALFHRRALHYARHGMWALAALHWRRAISQSPAEPVYYKALGRADVRLGRYAEAVRAFRSGAEAAPNDAEFARLIEKVRSHARSS